MEIDLPLLNGYTNDNHEGYVQLFPKVSIYATNVIGESYPSFSMVVNPVGNVEPKLHYGVDSLPNNDVHKGYVFRMF